MIVEQIWTGNAYRNFNYLIACPETGEALAIDPLDHEKCLGRAKDKGWDITQILRQHFGKRLALPLMQAPKWLIAAVGPLIDPYLTRRLVQQNVGHHFELDSTKAREALGMTFRPVDRALAEMIEEMIARGEVRDRG